MVCCIFQLRSDNDLLYNKGKKIHSNIYENMIQNDLENYQKSDW